MKHITSILKVGFGNIVLLIFGILIGFLLPKILTVYDYGVFRKFNLYYSYLTLLHFGFITGIYLKNGGKKYNETNKKKFSFYFRFLFIFEVVLSLLLIIPICFIQSLQMKFILLSLSVNIIFVNLIMFFQYVEQATSEFSKYSVLNIVKSVLNFLPLLILLLFFLAKNNYIINYKYYIVFFTMSNFLSTIVYVFSHKDIVFSKSERASNAEIKEIFKIGIPLMIGNLISTLLLNVDRQFVDIFFTPEEYAIYAFAYSLMSLITTCLSALTVVFFPYLKRANIEYMKEKYNFFLSIISSIISILLILYFPLVLFIQWFLPDYIGSLQVFRIIFPGVVLLCSITCIMHNYYLSLNKEKVYLFYSLIVLVISIVANIIAYILFKNFIAISCASVISLAVWYIVEDRYLKKTFKIHSNKNFCFCIIIILLFYLCAFVKNIFYGLLFYVIIILLVNVIFNYHLLKKKREELK